MIARLRLTIGFLLFIKLFRGYHWLEIGSKRRFPAFWVRRYLVIYPDKIKFLPGICDDRGKKRVRPMIAQ